MNLKKEIHSLIKIFNMEDFNSIEKDRKNLEHMPDQKLHQIVSFIKSGIRIAACFAGMFGLIGWGFVGLLLAELVGVYEELV